MYNHNTEKERTFDHLIWPNPKPYHYKITFRIENNLYNLIKSIYEKPTVNIIFNGARLKCFPVKLVLKQKCYPWHIY